MVEHSLQNKDSANQMYLFKVWRRQTIDINIINVVVVSLLLALNIFRWLGAISYQQGYFFQASFALRVANVRQSILFNIVRYWNQSTFKSCMAGASAFGWFLVILPGVGWFWAISDYFMIYTFYMIYFF